MNDKNDTISTKKFLILFPVLFIILILLIIYIVNATNGSKVNLYSDNINEDLKYLNE